MRRSALVLSLVPLCLGCKREPTATHEVATVMPFEVGQLVIYPGRGVVLIEGNEVHDGRRYVALKEQGSRIIVPVENLGSAVRRPMPAAQAEALLARLKTPDGKADERHTTYRLRDILRTLARGTIEQQAEKLHELYLSAFRYGFGERKLMRQLEDVVLGEAVLATSTPRSLDEVARGRTALAEQLHAGRAAFSDAAPLRPPERPLERPQVSDPFSLPGTLYLGTFSVKSGKVAAGDPTYVGDGEPGRADRQGFVLLNAFNGKWHAYVRTTDEGVAMLFAFVDPSVIGGALAAPTREEVGRLWVDSGQMAILDGSARTEASTADAMLFPLFQQTLVLDHGCMSASGGGDGTYPVLAATREGKTTWLGVDFMEEPEGELTSTWQFLRDAEQKIKAIKK